MATGRAWVIGPAVLVATAWSSVVHAEDPPLGWTPSAAFSGSGAVGTNSGVVGQTDGTSVTLGGSIKLGLDHRGAAVVLKNALSYELMFTLTPTLSEFVKTIDKLHLSSVLYWRLCDWIGPYGSFELEAATLPGFDVQPALVDYRLGDHVVAEDVDRIRLTKGFQPLTYAEEVGGFVRFVETKTLDLVTRLGMKLTRTTMGSARSVADSDATTEIDLIDLPDVLQAGPSLVVEVTGTLAKETISFSAHAGAMIPIVDGGALGRSPAELTNVDIGLELSVKVVEWLSIDYTLSVVRQPELVDRWQTQSNLLLTLSYKLAEE